jgi:hypothetical protein
VKTARRRRATATHGGLHSFPETGASRIRASLRTYSLVAWPHARQSAEWARRSGAGLVQTAKVTHWAHLAQAPATWRQGSHQGYPEVMWKSRIQGGDDSAGVVAPRSAAASGFSGW